MGTLTEDMGTLMEDTDTLTEDTDTLMKDMGTLTEDMATPTERMGTDTLQGARKPTKCTSYTKTNAVPAMQATAHLKTVRAGWAET
ncbi:uncharacterized protein IUM83_02821 [Phytophthora cinnamomi]|uniref:uncharacterized protein n=1 Tax=Phytophthora cinnamomi TaxID=4785 RepID=UPI00355A8CA4|nr:hypothetical protein IUM83_02821 [Phytophthora cinnamomi]